MLHYSDVTCVNATKCMQIQTLLVYKQKIKDISNTLSKENHSEFCLACNAIGKILMGEVTKLVSSSVVIDKYGSL